MAKYHKGVFCFYYSYFAEFKKKCESTGEVGISGVSVLSGGKFVPWE